MDSRLFLIKPKDLTAFTFQISSNRRALSYNIDGTDDFLKEAAKNLHSNSALRRQSGSATSNDQMPIPLRKRKGAKKWSDLPGSKRTTGVGHFVDWKRARVSGGDGGDGGLSLASLFANEMAGGLMAELSDVWITYCPPSTLVLYFLGPDGGDGGNGGHVIFQASRDVHSLDKVPSLITAESGVPGKGSKCDGKNAKHLTVHVPVGTVFRWVKRIKDIKEITSNLGKFCYNIFILFSCPLRNTETREILCELVDEEAIFLAAKGGAGGKGNHYFKSSTNQAPKVAEAGGKGECFIYEIGIQEMCDKNNLLY